MTEGLGADWQMAKIAFKPYACGTMLHPFIDCAIRLAREGVAAAEVDEVVCRVGEGTVHRLWEPLAEKREPSTPYSAKFSGPFAIALGLVEQAAGLEQFAEAKVRDPGLLALAARVRYEIDPDNAYPRNYTGEVRVLLAGRQRARSAAALSARRRARAARARRDRRQVSRQRRLWRLAGGRGPAARGVVRAPARAGGSARPRIFSGFLTGLDGQIRDRIASTSIAWYSSGSS